MIDDDRRYCPACSTGRQCLMHPPVVAADTHAPLRVGSKPICNGCGEYLEDCTCEIAKLRADLAYAIARYVEAERERDGFRTAARGDFVRWCDENKDEVVKTLGHENGRLEAERDQARAQLEGMTGERDAEREISRVWEEKCADLEASAGAMREALEQVRVQAANTVAGADVDSNTALRACLKVSLSALAPGAGARWVAEREGMRERLQRIHELIESHETALNQRHYTDASDIRHEIRTLSDPAPAPTGDKEPR